MLHGFNPLQALVDGMNAEDQRARAASEQWTLGEMIAHLEALPTDKSVSGLGELMSYRGYYSDLAFEPTSTDETAASILQRCRAAMGEVFPGYKGGDFVMGRNTPLWVAPYGCCGDKLMGLTEDGRTITEPDD